MLSRLASVFLLWHPTMSWWGVCSGRIANQSSSNESHPTLWSVCGYCAAQEKATHRQHSMVRGRESNVCASEHHPRSRFIIRRQRGRSFLQMAFHNSLKGMFAPKTTTSKLDLWVRHHRAQESIDFVLLDTNATIIRIFGSMRNLCTLKNNIILWWLCFSVDVIRKFSLPYRKAKHDPLLLRCAEIWINKYFKITMR